MRIPKVERGNGWADRALYGVIRLASGYRAPDVVRTLKYRSGHFGGPHSAHTQDVMRGPSRWAVWERELFAAYVSHVNQCRF